MTLGPGESSNQQATRSAARTLGTPEGFADCKPSQASSELARLVELPRQQQTSNGTSAIAAGSGAQALGLIETLVAVIIRESSLDSNGRLVLTAERSV